MKQKVASYFPLALGLCLLCFTILAFDYNYSPEPDFVVGTLVLVFGFFSLIGVFLLPNGKE